MNTVLKCVVSLLSFVGIMFVWHQLNHISNENITNVGAGDFVLMCIGGFTVGRVISNAIWNK